MSRLPNRQLQPAVRRDDRVVRREVAVDDAVSVDDRTVRSRCTVRSIARAGTSGAASRIRDFSDHPATGSADRRRDRPNRPASMWGRASSSGAGRTSFVRAARANCARYVGSTHLGPVANARDSSGGRPALAPRRTVTALGGRRGWPAKTRARRRDLPTRCLTERSRRGCPHASLHRLRRAPTS
jgi:hypothetical protein